MKQDFFPNRNRWTITVHVDTEFIQDGINNVIGFSKMPAAGRRKECTEVSGTVCMNRVLSSLPKNETREDLFWSTKVKLGEDENTVTVLYVMHSRLSIVLSLPLSLPTSCLSPNLVMVSRTIGSNSAFTTTTSLSGPISASSNWKRSF